MATAKTGITWTNATWNPLRGCSRVSLGCERCYAEQLAGSAKLEPHYCGVVRHTARGPRWNGRVVCAPDPIWAQPLKWRRARRIFVNSMSDLFHECVPVEWIKRSLDVMRQCPQHTFQVLTKRADRVADLATRLDWPSNLWMGVSIESSAFALRAERLAAVPVAVRWVSAEPLLGPLDALDLTGISWIVIGGESGPGYRAMKVEWMEHLAQRARDAGVAVFVKQDSAYRSGQRGRLPDELWALKQFPDTT